MALVQLGIANGEVIDAEKCTVKHSFKWFLCRCLLSGLRDLALGQVCERCSKGLIEGKIQRALSGMPAQLIERVNARVVKIQQKLELEKRFGYLEDLIKSEITSADERFNKLLEIWNSLYGQVEGLWREVGGLRENMQANQSELKQSIETQAREIEAVKKKLEEMHTELIGRLGKIDLCLFEQRMMQLRMELQQIGGRFHSSGVRGSRIPLLIRETHPG